MKFKEPRQGVELEFRLIPRHLLKNSPFQRNLSVTLVNKLSGSIFYGFLIPLLVVPGEDGTFEVVDGQHRLAGLHKSKGGDVEVPCIVAPRWVRELPIIFNIEKGDNIKDKATKLYNLYMHKLAEVPSMEEKELARSCGYESYLLTIAFSFMEYNLKSPSLVETVVKLLDKDFVDAPLEEAVEERRRRGKKVAELEEAVVEVCSSCGITDFNLKRAVVSRSKEALWGRKRSVAESFSEGMEMMIAKVMTTDWSYLARV